MQSLIAMGGNLGSVEDTFQAALRDLNAVPGITVKRVSSFYRTLPMGQNAGEAYLNAAVELSVAVSPLELLDTLQTVEAQHGRQRKTHWGPRPLDLDLLLYEQEILNHPRLMLPHPGCWYRRFVLDPLAEIAAEVWHPLKQLTIGELRNRLLERPLSVGIAGGEPNEQTRLAKSLSESFPQVRVKPWSVGDSIPTLLCWLGPPGDQDLRFDDLPLWSRLDLTSFPDPPPIAARNVLSAALG